MVTIITVGANAVLHLLFLAKFCDQYTIDSDGSRIYPCPKNSQWAEFNALLIPGGGAIGW